MKINFNSKPYQTGWSLIELVLATTILGILSFGAWAILAPNNRPEDLAASESQALTRVNHALAGYALVHHRLPYADQSAKQVGTESPDAVRGWLAVRTLGLPDGLRVEYAVDPVLSETPRVRLSPAISSNLSVTARTQPNGFDFCSALITTQRHGSLTAADIPMAYAILYAPSLEGGTQVNQQIMELPDSSGTSRPRHRAIGAAELLQTLRCPSLTTKAATAAIQAQAAEEITRLAEKYREFRDMKHRDAKASEFSAEVSVALDSVFMVLTGFDIVTGAFKVILKPRGERTLAGLKLANSTLSLIRQGIGLALDADALAKAPGSTAKAATALSYAYQWETRAQNYAHQTQQHAKTQLERGLQP